MAQEDEDRRRVYRDMEESKEWERVWDTLILTVIGVAVAGGLLFAGASWADGQFGWNLTGWLHAWIDGIVSGLKQS